MSNLFDSGGTGSETCQLPFFTMSSLHVLSAKGTQHEARSAAFPAPSNGLKDVRSSMQSSPSKRVGQEGAAEFQSV